MQIPELSPARTSGGRSHRWPRTPPKSEGTRARFNTVVVALSTNSPGWHVANVTSQSKGIRQGLLNIEVRNKEVKQKTKRKSKPKYSHVSFIIRDNTQIIQVLPYSLPARMGCFVQSGSGTVGYSCEVDPCACSVQRNCPSPKRGFFSTSPAPLQHLCRIFFAAKLDCMHAWRR